ncbi:MAG: OmpA family protein [Pseudomonadota bacterium]
MTNQLLCLGVAWITLTTVTAVLSKGAIEHDLHAASMRHVNDGDSEWLNITLSGRDAKVSGVAPASTDVQSIMKRISSVYGVRVVSNDIEVHQRVASESEIIGTNLDAVDNDEIKVAKTDRDHGESDNAFVIEKATTVEESLSANPEKIKEAADSKIGSTEAIEEDIEEHLYIDDVVSKNDSVTVQAQSLIQGSVDEDQTLYVSDSIGNSTEIVMDTQNTIDEEKTSRVSIPIVVDHPYPDSEVGEDLKLAENDDVNRSAECGVGLSSNDFDSLIFFETGEYTISQMMRSTLNDTARVADVCQDYQIQITGHTDSSGKQIYNEWLSVKRADVVADFLSEKGIPRSRMKVLSASHKSPVDTNETSDGRANNRRTEINVISWSGS